MKKRLACIILALIVLGNTIALAAGDIRSFKKINVYSEGMFVDVPLNAWYAPNVKMGYELGLIKGASETTFEPDSNVTIAETLVFACRLHSIYYTGEATFVQGSPWYQVYVDYAIENGLIGKNTYSNYSIPATRAQFATILAGSIESADLEPINAIADGEIPDVDVHDEYADAVYLLYRAGILTGSDERGMFYANSTISRAEAAAIITRIVDRSLRKTVNLASTNQVMDDLIYELTTTAMLHMFTNGGESSGWYTYDMSGYAGGYCYDTNGDGIEDWIVKLQNGSWMICTAGSEGYRCNFFTEGNAYLYLYASDELNRLILNQGNGLVTYVWDRYSIFDGYEFEEVAYEYSEYMMNDDGSYGNGFGPPQYKVYGEPIDEAGYKAAIEAFGTLTPLELISFEFEKNLGVKVDMMLPIAKALERLPFALKRETDDLNEDGIADQVIYLEADSSNGPDGVNMNGDMPRYAWTDACIVLLSANGYLQANICSWDEADEMLRRVEVSEVAETGIVTLADGKYKVELYEDRFYDMPNGLYAYVEVKETIVFDDVYVRSLKLGDVISLKEYGLNDIKIERLSYVGDEYTINISDGVTLVRNNSRSFKRDDLGASDWVIMGNSDIIYTYVAEETPVLFADDALIVDDLSYNLAGVGVPKQQLSDPRELFDSPVVGDSETVNITISGGKVVELYLDYHS